MFKLDIKGYFNSIQFIFISVITYKIHISTINAIVILKINLYNVYYGGGDASEG